MINNENMVHAQECKCLAWKPIIAGALAAIGFTFLLNVFSVAIGLTAFTTNSEGIESLAFGGLLGTGLGIIVSMFAAGWIAGYLSQRHCNKRHLGALYGFLTWCLALIVAIFITSHVQHYISFYGHFLSGTTNLVLDNTSSANDVTVAANHLQTNSLVISTYIIFSLFFLSAFACSLGGHCGMRHICKETTCR
jgi:hypothetical protein